MLRYDNVVFICFFKTWKYFDELPHHGGEDMKWAFVFQNTELVTHVWLNRWFRF
jgi:hypothetical protein